MRIVTWNINGARTLPQYHPWNTKKNWAEILEGIEGSIICFQEMKSSKQQLDRNLAIPDGYDGFFSFPVTKGGYSGVAVYTKRADTVPLKAEEGLTSRLQPKPPLSRDELVSTKYPQIDDFELEKDDNGATPTDVLELDSEGRALVLDFGMFVLINLYCPAETVDARIPFKMNFHRLLGERIRTLLNEGREVIVLGDINICATPLDHCEYTTPSTIEAFWEREPRVWLRDWLVPQGPLIDIVRRQWPDRKCMYTCWNTRISARESNYGTRIDYIFCTAGIEPWIAHADIQPLIKGSDHCPVFVDLHDSITTPTGETLVLRELMQQTDPPRAPPRIAACHWDVFLARQTLLSKFFGKDATTKTPSPTPTPTLPSEPELPEDTGSQSQDQRQSPPLSSQTSTATELGSQPETSARISPAQAQSSTPKQQAAVKKRKSGQQKLVSFFKQSSVPQSRVRPDSATPELGASQQIDDDFALAQRLAEEESDSTPAPLPLARTSSQAKSAWSSLLAPVQPPNCDVHGEPATRRTTTKPGPNKGKVFYACSRPLGPGYDQGKGKRLRSEVDPQYKCDYFKWEADVKRAVLREGGTTAASNGGPPSKRPRVGEI